MFEFEAGVHRHQGSEYRFSAHSLESALGTRILRRCLTVWQEHCSECAMPDCYSSCAFYSPRQDFKCRRFSGGVGILESTEHTAAPMLIRFGRWARLLGYGPVPLQAPAQARQREARALRNELLLDQPASLRGLLAPVRRRFGNTRAEVSSWGGADLTKLHVVIEAINGGTTPVVLSLSCKLLDEPGRAPVPPLLATLTFETGHSIKTVPVASFVPAGLLDRKFAMQLSPANDGDMPQLAFGFFDIAELESAPGAKSAPKVTAPVADAAAKGPPKIKCVVWDLDNTLWEGVLIEDGLSKLRLRAEAVRAIDSLDRKGILQSVASKNDPEEALAALRHFGLAEYFLHPQISWGPKSQALATIRQRLNIGMDTFAFVDDQEFERAEVTSQHAEVLGIDSLKLEQLASNPRFDVEVTEEAAQRRRLYQEEEQREAAATEASGNIEEFLRSCQMRVQIAPLAEADVARAYELAQRTNQLNISTSRYTADQLRQLLFPGATLQAFTVRAADRFGNYGLIGLCVFDPAKALILDLMFSCRIQGKLVDEAFVAWLAQSADGDAPLSARYSQSRKNSPAREMLERNGFVRGAAEGEQEIWNRTREQRPLAEVRRIIEVSAPEMEAHA